MQKITVICFVAVLFFALCGFSAAAQGLNARFLSYIEQYKDIAMEQCRAHGVPASITLAQGLLESNAGASYLATRGNNHFGIKCHRWAGEAVEFDDTLKHDCYRKYDSPRDSFEDHSLFLCGRLYQPLHELDITDYRGWATGLKECGYAEDPAYAQKLINIIERYELHQYDTIDMADARVADAPAPHKKSKKEPKTVPPSRPKQKAKPAAKRPILIGSPDNDD